MDGALVCISLSFLSSRALVLLFFSFSSLGAAQPTYNDSSVDAHDKVEPRLHGQLRVGVAQDLETKEALLLVLVVVLLLPRVLAVEAGDEAIEGVEHVGHLGSIGLDGLEEELSRALEREKGGLVVLCRTSLLATAICWPHARRKSVRRLVFVVRPARWRTLGEVNNVGGGVGVGVGGPIRSSGTRLLRVS